jgi:hypothetical protein
MQLFMLFIDSNTLHVSGVTRPSSGAQELSMQPMVVMLLYVMIGSTVLSMGLWLMWYKIMWMFTGCGLRDLVPLVGSLSVLVTVRVYTDGPRATCIHTHSDILRAGRSGNRIPVEVRFSAPV